MSLLSRKSGLCNYKAISIPKIRNYHPIHD